MSNRNNVELIDKIENGDFISDRLDSSTDFLSRTKSRSLEPTDMNNRMDPSMPEDEYVQAKHRNKNEKSNDNNDKNDTVDDSIGAFLKKKAFMKIKVLPTYSLLLSLVYLFTYLQIKGAGYGRCFNEIKILFS